MIALKENLIMKKLLLSTMLFALSFAYGQEKKENEKLTIEKGTWYVGGNVSLGHTNSEFEDSPNTSKYFNFNFSPKIGYTFNDNLILGLGLGYGYTESESGNTTNNQVNTTNHFRVFPYIKKYFPVGKKLTISLQGEFRYSYSEYEKNDVLNSNGGHTNEYFIGVRPGITYFLNKNLALEANIGTLGYNNATQKSGSPSKRTWSSFNFNINSTDLMFGLSYYW
ncbi:hypothetical protein KUL113_40170 [Tenacibaculum sp. KUL113]|nr:hypothetical protein KUL113_40170 [Tenacibaculum sp. KUL113]